MEEEKINLPKMVTMVLLKMGISPNLKGFKYLKEGIMLIIEDNCLIENFRGGLYPKIAKKFGDSECCIERNIRHAIDVYYNKSNSNRLSEVLGYKVNPNEKPTTRELIALLVEYMYIQFL